MPQSDPDSNSGRQGSTFYFTLPYNAIPNEQTCTENVISFDSAANPINPEVPELKIMIVEDDGMSELFLREAIKSF